MDRQLVDQELDNLTRSLRVMRGQSCKKPGARKELNSALWEMAQAILSLQVAREIEDRHADGASGGPEVAGGKAHDASLIKGILGSLPGSFVVMDRDFNVLMGNWQGGNAAAGNTHAAGRKCYEMFHHGEHPCKDCHLPQILATAEPRLVKKIDHCSGKVYEISAFPILNESGQVSMVAKHIRDITALRTAEKALQESEELYRVLTESSLAGVYLIQDHKFRYVNPVLAQILGYTPEELIDRVSPRDTIHPDDRSWYDDYARQRLAGEVEEIHYIFRGLRRDGTVIFLESLGRRIEYRGQPAIVGTLLDITARKHMEEALTGYGQFIGQILETIPNPVFYKDVHGAILGCNKAFAEDAGVPQAEIAGKMVHDFFPGELARQCDAADQEALQYPETRVQMKFQTPGPDGGCRHKVCHKAAYKDNSGNPGGVVSVTTDITELHRAQEALQASEARYRTLFETSPYATAVLDAQMNFVMVNQRGVRQFGYDSVAEIIGKNAVNTIAPADRPHVLPLIQAMFATGESQTAEFDVLKQDGTPIPCLATASLVRDAAGEPQTVIVVTQDITARKRAETAVRESEARYRALFEASPHATCLMDLQTNILMANPQALKLLGYDSAAEILGRKGLDDFAPEDRARLVASVQNIAETGQVPPLEAAMIIRDGQRIPCLASASLVRDATGRPQSIIAVAQDISELKRAETAVRESEAKYRELVENASCIILRLDTRGHITFFNKFAQTFFGFTEEEIIGRHVVGTIVPERDSRGHDLAATLQNVVQHPERHYSNENENMRRNGGRVWVAWTNKASHGQDGKLNEVLCIGIDRTEQRGVEQALQESEERFRALFEHAAVGMVMADSNGRFLQTNPAYQAIVGYSAAELKGMTIQQVTHPEDLPELLRLRGGIFAGQRLYYSIEKRNLRKDGEIVWVNVMSARLTNARNQLRTVATTIDITARKRAEAELAKNHLELQETTRRLEQSRNMLEMVIEAIPVRVFWKDSDLRYLGCNSLFARDAGFTAPQQVIGRNDYAMVWGKQADLYRADDRQVIESRRPKMNIIEPQTTPEGTEIWLKTSKVPLTMQDTEAVGILGVYEDISAFKRAQEALRKSEQRFRLMAETIQDVFWIATPGIEQTTYVSPRYEQVWGRPRKEFYQSSQTLLEAIHPDDRQRVKSESCLAHERGEPFSLEYRIIRADGEVRWIQDRGFPVQDEQGDVVLFTGVATDITERKTLERQLLLAQKMEAVGRLAGGVAHDFNNLLMAIAGYGELMRAKVLKGDPLYGYLEDILKATDRAAGLTRQLLTFSRQQIVNPQVIDLNLLVLDLERMLGRLIEEDIDLQIITAPGLGVVQADPGYLHQIIMNLVINARDAMPRGGRIVVETATADFDAIRQTKSGLAPLGPYVRLSVRDNGVGMDEAIQTHIFEPFFTTKERGKGTGLGLSTVYGIVKQSGGFIDVESVPGEGSTFTVYLPRLGEVEAPAPKKLQRVTQFRGEEIILLVEDEDMLRTLLAKFLRLHGYTVLEARHGGEALLTCERHEGPIHIMVTDVVMPQMSGRELLDRLTPLYPEMQVIYMSGYTEDEVVRRGVSESSVAFLQKPFKPIDLVQQVYSILHPPEL